MEDFFEIIYVIKKNKLRTLLTGSSVAWGIFILVTLLGFGNSLQEGVLNSFQDLLQNKYFVTTGPTSMNFLGFPKGRDIELKQMDYKLLTENYPSVELKTPEISYTSVVSYKKQYKNQIFQGVSPDIMILNNIQILAGRFINKIDISNHRKVVVISSTHKNMFFKNEGCIGKYIRFSNSVFLVVGIYDDKYESVNTPMYVPFSTLQLIYNEDAINSLTFTVDGANKKEINDSFIANYRNFMGHIHRFDSRDKSALMVLDTSEDFQIIDSVLKGISLFIWLIGISTLLSGIVGVSNITLISVRERNREFGIRRTMGATPFSIIKNVIFESVIITLFGGYIGILFSYLVIELINYILLKNQPFDDMIALFNAVSIDLMTAFKVNLLLVIVGIIAGVIPAKKAVYSNIVASINKV